MAADQTIRIDVIARAKSQQLKQFQRELRGMGAASAQAAGQTAASMTLMGRASHAVGTALLVGVGGALAVGIKAAIEFESSFAGVRKTVEASEPAFQRLARSIRDLSLDIPINVNDLNRIAELGGQLGIGADELTEFTEVIAKLGVATNLEVDEAATSVARFANVMGTRSGDFDRIGAAVVDLGNNFATTESEILTFATRLSGIGATIGASEADVLGLATAFTSLGEPAERGATAVQRTFVKMLSAVEKGGNELDLFAKTAGMTTDAFADLFREDPVKAFIAFERGLNQVRETGGSVITVLDSLGLGSERTRALLLKGATAWRTLSTAVNTASMAYEDNAALDEEAQKRFDTTASQIQLLGNRFRDLAISIGQESTGPIRSTIEVFGGFLKVLQDNTWALKAMFAAAVVLASGRGIGKLTGVMLRAFNETHRFEGAVIRGLMAQQKAAGAWKMFGGVVAGAVIALGAVATIMAVARARTERMEQSVRNLADSWSEFGKDAANNSQVWDQTIKSLTVATAGILSDFSERDVREFLVATGTSVSGMATLLRGSSEDLEIWIEQAELALRARRDLAIPGSDEFNKLDILIHDFDLFARKARQVRYEMEQEIILRGREEFPLGIGTSSAARHRRQNVAQQVEDAMGDLTDPGLRLQAALDAILEPDKADELFNDLVMSAREFGMDFADTWRENVSDFASQANIYKGVWEEYEQIQAVGINTLRENAKKMKADDLRLLLLENFVATTFGPSPALFFFEMSEEDKRNLAAIMAKDGEESFLKAFDLLYDAAEQADADAYARVIPYGPARLEKAMENEWPAFAKDQLAELAAAMETAIEEDDPIAMAAIAKQWQDWLGELPPEMKSAIPGFMQRLGDEFALNTDPLDFRQYMNMTTPERIKWWMDQGATLAQAVALGFSTYDFSWEGGTIPAVQKWGGEVINAAGQVFETQSPSKAFRRIGEQVAQGFGLGLEEGMNKPANSAFLALMQQPMSTQSSGTTNVTEIHVHHPNHPTDDLTADLQRASVLAGFQRIAESRPLSN